MPKPVDLSRQLRMIAGSKISADGVGRSAMNPASKGRAGEIELWEGRKRSFRVMPHSAFECRGRQIRRSPLESGSRQSVESGEPPFGTYRKLESDG